MLLKKIHTSHDTSRNIFVVFLVITSTITYLDKVQGLNYRTRFLSFSKDMQKVTKKLTYKNSKASMHIMF